MASKTRYPDLAALMLRGLAAADPPLTATEFGVQSGLGRQVAGRIIRGEQIPEPRYISKIVSMLPITTEQILSACGYGIGVPPAKRIPQALVDAYLSLSPDDQRQTVRGARALADYRPPQGDRP